MDQAGFDDYKHIFLHGKSTLEAYVYVQQDVVDMIKNSVERFINEAGPKLHFLISGILPMGCHS